MDRLILYNYFRSSTSFRVRIALELKKLPYEYKPIHLLNNGGEQHSAEYRSLNAMGSVPTLVHETSNNQKNILGQSMAILEYLDDAFPQTYQLFAKDVYKKNLIRQFCENINADIHSYGNLRTLQYLEKNLSATEDQKTKWIHHWISTGLQACENFLNSEIMKQYQGQFCFGNDITAADLLLIPQIVTAQRFKTPLEQFKKLNSIFENCMMHEAFVKAHPFRQIDTPDDLKIK